MAQQTHEKDVRSSWNVFHRVTGGLAASDDGLVQWFPRKLAIKEGTANSDKTLHPVIEEFQQLIEGDPILCAGFHQMFEQIPSAPPYDKDPRGRPQVRDYKLMLKLFNDIITSAPAYEDSLYVAFPINAILCWPMGTPAGSAMLTDPRVNRMFKKMFDVWSTFLTSSDSRYVLTTDNDGWFGPRAREKLPHFAETFVCDPSQSYYGFSSWDDFFTRTFRPGVRPVASPDDDSIITNACESSPYRIAHGAQASDRFWLKGSPYSLAHMLADAALARTFAGGPVYQAFLSATSYHRWHSPVRGTVVRTAVVPGAYYASSPAHVLPHPPDPAAQTRSQAYLTSVAARALVLIQADSPDIGLVCFLAVGMAEVSTCEVTVRAGDRLEKGGELGMFHFGGSTHCLIFRPETKVTFLTGCHEQEEVPVNAALATVRPSVRRE